MEAIQEQWTSGAAALAELTPLPGTLKFAPSDGFHAELKRRVDRHFVESGQRPRDCPSMYLKTAIIITWTVASYYLLVFSIETWAPALVAAISLGLALAAIGFNIQHDGSHHAYSKYPAINTLMALSLDLLGGSSYFWARKHNRIHHTFVNVTGHDDDIDIGLLGRLSPHQPRLGFHRFQHFYLWILYGFLTLKWHLYDDYRDLIRGRIGGYKVVRPRKWDLLLFMAGKAVFFAFALVIPMLYHPVWVALAYYLVVSFTQGWVLSVVFQLAHCVEEANFPMPEETTGRMESAWAAHQVETTVDFARGNSLLSWYVGGLNFQVVHHLFPQICHVHYPALSHVIEETCKDFGVRYSFHPSLGSCMASHFRWLKKMGQPASAS